MSKVSAFFQNDPECEQIPVQKMQDWLPTLISQFSWISYATSNFFRIFPLKSKNSLTKRGEKIK